MGDLNFSKCEIDALNGIDARALDAAISQCLENRSILALSPFRLSSCGSYVARKAIEFDSALRAFAAAKAPKKRDSTGATAYRAGSSLSSALRVTQEALEKEVQDGERFRVSDDVIIPMSFRTDMSVRVCYQWRASPSDVWTHGSILFTHTVVRRMDYSYLSPKRRSSAAVEARKQQEELYTEWNQLKNLALWSVRDFFRSGGIAGDVPAVFPVVLDDHSRQLNNYSANFWRHRSARDSPESGS